MKNKKNISILGCGWLGLPLAKHLIDNGNSVKGSTTKSENMATLKEKGIKPFLIKITNEHVSGDNIKDFLNSEILIINFPPQRRSDIEQYHIAQFELLIHELKISPVKNVLFISSTSVYPDLNREVFEDETASPTKGSGKALKAVEQMLIDQSSFKTTIVRFGGLVGYDRMPGRFLAGKKNVTKGNTPINIIHQDDCILIIYQVINQLAWGEIFNACSDKHPTRAEYYVRAAQVIGIEPPEFEKDQSLSYKVINSEKIKKILGYTFKYPDPVELLTLETRI